MAPDPGEQSVGKLSTPPAVSRQVHGPRVMCRADEDPACAARQVLIEGNAADLARLGFRRLYLAVVDAASSGQGRG